MLAWKTETAREGHQERAGFGSFGAFAMLQTQTEEPALSALGEEVDEQSAGNPALQEFVARAAQKVFGTVAKAWQHIVPGARLWGRVRSGRVETSQAERATSTLLLSVVRSGSIFAGECDPDEQTHEKWQG